jgi:hypothetical protein
METGVRNDNPFSGLKPYRLGTYHTWTDAEIRTYLYGPAVCCKPDVSDGGGWSCASVSGP